MGLLQCDAALHKGNLRWRRNRHQNGTMPIWAKTGTRAVLICGLAVSLARAGAEPGPSGASKSVRPGSTSTYQSKTDRTLSQDDRLSVIAAAMDPKVRKHSARDCSHLVHAIYERAGFSYSYASSNDLYLGVEGFQRVPQPQPGDLLVSRAHAAPVLPP